MKVKDELQRFLFEKAPVRGELVRLHASRSSIIEQHHYPPHLQAYLSEALVAACLLTATIKFHGRLTLQFKGKDKVKLLVVQCNQDLHLRGLIDWDKSLTPDKTLAAFQDGTFAIMIEPDKAEGQRYQGIVPWQGDSIAHSIEGYFMRSEQLPTRIFIAQNDQDAVGLLLQVMPEDKSQSLDYDWEHINALASTVRPQELLTLDNESLLRRLFAGEDIRLFASSPVIFNCTCTPARGENAILLLGKEEVEQELKDKSFIQVTCEFCNRSFTFDRVDIAKIFQKGNKPPTSTQLH